MKVENLTVIRDWNNVLNRCRTTLGKDETENEPSDSFKAKMCLSQHSPLRQIEFEWKWRRIPYAISVHFLRHILGNNPDVEPFIQTQRDSRMGKSRKNVRQSKLIDMDYTCNAQALLNISNKRLCKCADITAQKAWKLVVDEVAKVEPIIASKCVPSCVARGRCPELFSPCGYDKTDAFKKAVEEYWKVD